MEITSVGRTFTVLVLGLLIFGSTSGCTSSDPEVDSGSGIPQLAFVSDREGSLAIYLTNIDTTFVRRLTSDTGHEYGLTWSGNGERLAFVSFDSGNQDIFSIAPGDSVWTPITDSPDVGESSPHYSRDGQWIAYASGRDHPLGEIYLADVSGENIQRLTENDVYDTSPRFSPDGSRLAFCRQFVEEIDGGQVKNGDIVIMDLGTGVEIRITEGPRFDCLPSWSPDGTRIVYHQCDAEGGTGCDIRIMDANGENDDVLVADERENGWPEFSPDGAWIAYMSAEGDESDIWLVRPDGSEKRALIENPGRDEVAVWRPRVEID